jgi:hypothetical protein
MTERDAIELAQRTRTVLAAAGIDPAAAVRVLAPEILGIPVCRGCGCTDLTPCDAGCEWVAPDLCSACVEGEAQP